MAESTAAHQSARVPGDVFACHTHPGHVAIKRVQIMDMFEQHGVNFRYFGLRQVRAGIQEMFDLAKYPRPTLCGTADHHGIRAGVSQHKLCFFRRGDVAVGDDGNARRRLDSANGVVFGIAGIGAGASAAVHRQRLHAGIFGNAEDA